MSQAAVPEPLAEYSLTPTPALRLGAHAASVVALAAGFRVTWALPVYLLLGTSLVEAALVDLGELRLPNRLLAVPAAVGIVAFPLLAVADQPGSVGRAFAAAAVAFVGMLLLHIVYPAGMGLGDVKLATVMGLYLGWLAWEAVGVAFLGAIVVSGLVSGYLIRRDRTGSTALPMGPFLVAATIASAAIYA